jgi:hypothetical protein
MQEAKRTDLGYQLPECSGELSNVQEERRHCELRALAYRMFSGVLFISVRNQRNIQSHPTVSQISV